MKNAILYNLIKQIKSREIKEININGEWFKNLLKTFLQWTNFFGMFCKLTVKSTS